MKKRIWLLLKLFIGAMILFACAVAFLLFDNQFRLDESKLNDPREASVIYYENGELIRPFCNRCRTLIPLKEMGVVPQFTAVTEDHRIFIRWGPQDPLGLLRAMLDNVQSLRIKGGGSTISEQLVADFFLQEELRAYQDAKSPMEKTEIRWRRRILKAILAARLDYDYSRVKILTDYLNNVYCGNGLRNGVALYGAKLCSIGHFNKNPDELNIAEIAWLIGTFRNPRVTLAPQSEESRRLRSRVLQQFVETPYIPKRGEYHYLLTAQEKEKWDSYPLPSILPVEDRNPAAHFAELVRQRVAEKMIVADQGLEIHSTLNGTVQRIANASGQRALDRIREINPEADDLRFVAIFAARNGAIKVFSQLPSFRENQYRGDQIQRPLGSVAKIFAITAWLEAGGRLRGDDDGNGPYMLDDSYGPNDGPCAIAVSMGRGKPSQQIHNFPSASLPRYRGSIPAMEGFSQSRNCSMESMILGVLNSSAPKIVSKEAILKLMTKRLRMRLRAMDLEEGKRKGMLIQPELAQELGIPENTVDPGLTIAIGSVDVSPYDLLKAVMGLTNELVELYSIELIKNAEGKTIYYPPQNDPRNAPQKVLDEKISLQLIRGLRGTIELPHGTGRRANWLLPEKERQIGFQVIGKTGTANSVFMVDGKPKAKTTDVWFAGCTPSYCGVVWMGREKRLPLMPEHLEGKPVGQVTGGGFALPVWMDIIKAFYEGQPREFFPENTDPFKPFRYEQKPSPPPEQPANGTVNLEGDDF